MLRSSSRESGSRKVMTSTFSLMILAASFRWLSRVTGPMPQPYIWTRLAGPLGRRMLAR